MKADILSLGETWLTNDDTISLEKQGFKEIFANVGSGQGLVTFIKTHHQISSDTFTHETFSATLVRTDNVDVISLYLSQSFSWPLLEKMLTEWIREDKNLAILGDVNLNYYQKKNHPFLKFLEEKNFVQLVKKPTSDGGGLIDHIYINQHLQEKKLFHSQRSVYFTNHDEIVLQIPF